MQPESLTLTRRFYFCAGHKLSRSDWSEEKNKEIFGLCANPHGHGHNYILKVGVSGPIDPDTGMIINLRKLKKFVEDKIVIDVDHRNLNEDVTWMKDIIPTTENFALKIWERIYQILPQLNEGGKAITLSELVLQETDNNTVTLRA